jgi:hypothetical protein
MGIDPLLLTFGVGIVYLGAEIVNFHGKRVEKETTRMAFEAMTTAIEVVRDAKPQPRKRPSLIVRREDHT